MTRLLAEQRRSPPLRGAQRLRVRAGGRLAVAAVVVVLLLLTSCQEPTTGGTLTVHGRVTTRASGLPIVGAGARVF